VVKKGNQTENLYIGESGFPFESFHLSVFSSGGQVDEAAHKPSCRDQVIMKLWSPFPCLSSPAARTGVWLKW
jgi:hypothetical protein